jgi:hypothetical protein
MPLSSKSVWSNQLADATVFPLPHRLLITGGSSYPTAERTQQAVAKSSLDAGPDVWKSLRLLIDPACGHSSLLRGPFCDSFTGGLRRTSEERESGMAAGQTSVRLGADV